MNTNEWITDRLPTALDAPNMGGYAWHAYPLGFGVFETVPTHWSQIAEGDIWCTPVIPIYRKKYREVRP